MICKFCNRSDILDTDMFTHDMCDDCFDLMMEREDLDFEIFNDQDGICKLCNQQLSGWKIIDDKAVCWPSCANKLDPPIKLSME